ncbi:MAG: Mur ligase domain-containing protein, partial [Burkholderiales bacterium]
MSEAIPLDELLAGIAPAPRVPVAGLTLDSRAVVPGEAFVALRGARSHGLEHADEAASRGARAVLWDPAEGREPLGLAGDVAFVAVRQL